MTVQTGNFRSVWRSVWRRIGLPILYLTFAATTLGPVVRDPLRLMPAGATEMATVPLFNVWSIWWNADRLQHGFRHYWDAPIFAPNRGAFAYSEPQPATLIVAPVIWITDSRVLAYNLYLIGSLVANGLVGARLLRTLGLNWRFAAVGGAAILLLPQVHEQLDVVQLVPLWPILWTLESVILLGRLPGLLRGLTAGVAFGCTCWTSLHHALFLFVLLLAVAPLLPIRWTRLATWKSIALGTVAAVLMSLPLALPIRHVAKANDFERTERMVDQLSAKPREFLTAPGSGLLKGGLLSEKGSRRRLPGWLNTALAAIAAGTCLCRCRRRRELVFLIAVVVAASALALGSNLRIGQWQPWWSLTAVIPGLSQVRNVFRFAYFFQVAVVMLGFLGIWHLRIHCRRTAGRTRGVLPAAFALVSAAMAAELYPRPIVTIGAPTYERHAAWINWVAQHTPPGKSVLYLPYVPGSTVGEFDLTARMMYLSTWHGIPVANGYSGYFPASHFQLQKLLAADFPNEAALQELANSGIGVIVALRSGFPPDVVRRDPAAREWLQLMFSDESGFDVYRLTSGPIHDQPVEAAGR